MFIPSFAVRLRRIVPGAGLSPLAPGPGNRRAFAHLPSPPRLLDCALVGAMTAAIALTALLCVAASRVGFAAAGRVGGWLP
ncbi:hypothetical protein NUV26_18740 [Burkholderia pseudomultivorans]|uniref:hypothetical protein n=1 Tax=Burkholderia pseudomultivorans TaxID=1207504 RepID=UPI0007562FB2|nr:hypothetical protein [Burkholderia pseudomultivorans]AOI87988.1 hypothetical protein WS57_03885 [Burkholderia pseudomultivorans]KVC34407.1 hypothetical protein WS56_11190 [Burkholderia pseudomultivorans]KVC39161.1 hypothetical protein WS55_03210 [Burkholderia pseudomultivorans]KVC53443.1 hypothetical protein WS58_33620 [Burkholderia pseudomultivorans]MDS0794204.1 hypothetical protein [Burkholderia pseudomultivorans]